MEKQTSIPPSQKNPGNKKTAQLWPTKMIRATNCHNEKDINRSLWNWTENMFTFHPQLPLHRCVCRNMCHTSSDHQHHVMYVPCIASFGEAVIRKISKMEWTRTKASSSTSGLQGVVYLEDGNPRLEYVVKTLVSPRETLDVQPIFVLPTATSRIHDFRGGQHCKYKTQQWMHSWSSWSDHFHLTNFQD